ncbi:MAG TPA: TauD/TfdA family dioxygenase [Sphingobium sp.]|uniref:TauD/TfdA dioxygenase family protein n=1 Tax=Sphingobium sp. TaxID=1912891 RepID=UPI002ED0D3D0
MTRDNDVATLFEPLKDHIGSRFIGSRDQLFDRKVAEHCRALLETRVILLFPEVHLSNEEQLAFTDLLGTRINISSEATTSKSDDVYQVTLDKKINRAPEYVLGTFFWHMDGMPLDMPVPKATLLSARSVAPKGGQTEFASTIAAYELMPLERREEVEDLHVIHSVKASLRPIADVIPEAHRKYLNLEVSKERPLVFTHPDGAKSFILGSTADTIAGMELAYGRALLARLNEWTTQPDFVYSHSWKQGDFVVWNNCGALHRVVPYAADSGRMMHRTSISG